MRTIAVSTAASTNAFSDFKVIRQTRRSCRRVQLRARKLHSRCLHRPRQFRLQFLDALLDPLDLFNASAGCYFFHAIAFQFVQCCEKSLDSVSLQTLDTRSFTTNARHANE